VTRTPADGLTPQQVELLQTRYGPARRHSRSAVFAVFAVSAAFVVWVVWAAFQQSDAAVRWRTVGYSEVTDTGVVVSFDVFKRAGATVVCTVRALDTSGEVVGEQRVEVSGPQTDVNVTYPLKVIRRPTAAEVESCAASGG
jgi:hypothetical protein